MRGRQRGEAELSRATWQPRGERDVEFGQARLGLLLGGVETPDGAAAPAWAAQDVGAESVLMELCPSRGETAASSLTPEEPHLERAWSRV